MPPEDRLLLAMLINKVKVGRVLVSHLLFSECNRIWAPDDRSLFCLLRYFCLMRSRSAGIICRRQLPKHAI